MYIVVIHQFVFLHNFTRSKEKRGEIKEIDHGVVYSMLQEGSDLSTEYGRQASLSEGHAYAFMCSTCTPTSDPSISSLLHDWLLSVSSLL